MKDAINREIVAQILMKLIAMVRNGYWISLCMIVACVLAATTCKNAGLSPGGCEWPGNCYTGVCYCDSACNHHKDCCSDVPGKQKIFLCGYQSFLNCR